MTAEGKPPYEAPSVMSLGEIGSGTGSTSCHDGSVASDCALGSDATQACNTGALAGQQCRDGGNATDPPGCTVGVIVTIDP